MNDRVLAAVAGGARQLFASRGELRPVMSLKATVAAAARDPADRAPTGNRAAIMLTLKTDPSRPAEPRRCRQGHDRPDATTRWRAQPVNRIGGAAAASR